LNQLEINSIDQYNWRDERNRLHEQIKQFCYNNGVEFSHFCSTELIANSKKSVIVIMWLFDMIPSYKQWQDFNEQCRLHGKTLLVITDNIIQFDDLDFVNFFSYAKLLGVCASYSDIELPATSQTPGKLYNCFIQRIDSVRQSWFYFLHHYNLLDKGYVSLLMYQLSDYSNLTGIDLFEYIHYQYQLDKLPKFQKSYIETRNQIPYQNFQELNNLIPLIQDSKYSLVLETYALENSGCYCFTEKSLRDLQFPTVSLLFLQSGGIAKLNSLGIQTPLCLNSLDNLPWHQRQQELLKILVEDSIEFDYNLLYNQAMHNRELLQTWKCDYQKSDFFEDVFNKISLL
jgi:hypothetical protein